MQGRRNWGAGGAMAPPVFQTSMFIDLNKFSISMPTWSSTFFETVKKIIYQWKLKTQLQEGLTSCHFKDLFNIYFLVKNVENFVMIKQNAMQLIF